MKRIMIIDDNQELVEELQDALNAKGYTSFGLSDETQALTKIIENKPSLLVMDIKMKEKTGLQLALELSYHPETAGIPIILMTGYYSPTEVQRFMNLGIVKNWILKPIKLDELVQKIEAR